GGGPAGAVAGDRGVGRGATQLVGDRGGDDLGGGGGVVEGPAGPVPFEAVAHVHLLLEVVAQREVEEGAAERGQLHGGGEPALHQGEVAGGQVPDEVGQVGPHLDAGHAGQRGRVDAG